MQRAPLSPVAAEAPSSRGTVEITVERGPQALARHRVAWIDLVDHAVAPNPFFEPWALLPALEHLTEARDVETICVWEANPLPKQPAILNGLFPVVRSRAYKHVPLPTLEIWRHVYSYSGTPLVRAGRARETLEALLDWLPGAGISLFAWRTIATDSGFRHALTDVLYRRQIHTFEDERHTRAMFRPAATADAFLARAVGGKKHKELRRQLRRLAEVEPVTFEADADVERWIAEYLELEARGWKGGQGEALAHDPRAAALFRAWLHGAYEHGRLALWSMRQPSRRLPIAMKCNLRAGTGAVALKIAYDEELARYSPGVLLEIEHIAWMHQPGAPAWVDSGAAARHPMIDHLWRDRIGLETIAMPVDRLATVAIAAFPLLRLAQATVRRLRPPSRRPS